MAINTMVTAMRRRSLRQNRDYMLLWSGELFSELGSQTSAVAYPLLILSLTGSPAKAGVVGLAKWLPLAVCAIPAGALADRVNRKRLMIACDAIRMLGAASIVVMLAISEPSYLQIITVAFIDGALFTTSYICERGALSHVVAADQLSDAVAQNEARGFAATIAGPPLGGALFAVAGALPFIADTVSFLGSMTTISLTRAQFQTESPGAPQPRRTIRADISGGFAWLWQHPFFRATSVLFALGNPVFTGLYLLAILLAKEHGASPATVGLVLAVIGAGGMLGALSAGTLRRAMAPRAIIIAEQWLLLALVLALLLVRNPLLIGLAIAGAEFVTPTINSVVAGARVAATPDQLQGRVQAAAIMANMSLAWLGPLAVGLFYQHAGATTTILMLAGWTLISVAIATLAPALRDNPPGPLQAANP
jgi:predicted MFS family arabinose efflux permease